MSAKALAKLPPIQRSSPPPPANINAVISPRAGKAFGGLQGPSYQIGEGGKHKLPEPQALKPFVDTKAGNLDTWPAHATAQAAARPSLPSSQRPRGSSADGYGRGQSTAEGGGPHQSMVPKPKFLEQLEVFLKKELRNVDGGRAGPSDTRLQAYREVFEYLIEDFKAYKPIFSAIKNEYEVMLSHQREKIRELEPLKSMLVTVSEQCDQKIMALREDERQEMKDLKNEKQALLDRIGGMREEQFSLQMQIEKLQEKIAEQYQMYRDECDARKLLVSDINDLRYQQEDYQKAQGNQEVPAEAKEDPVKMKIALRKAREDLTDATQRLNEMIANYGDVVPRRDFELLTAEHKKLLEEHETLNGDYNQLRAEHEALLDVNKQIIAQRDDFYQELENLKRTATPRPDWDRCAEVLEGGEERWVQISQGKKTDQLVTLLLKEIMGDGEGYEYFEPKGLGDDVPVYMRYEGKLRKRKMDENDAGILIKEIWREKTKQNQERGEAGPEPMDIFLASFMRQKYPEEKLAFEWTYMLLSILEENEKENHLMLFYKTLIGEMDEDVYHNQLEVLSELMAAFKKADEEEGGQGSFNKDILELALREFFPIKDDDSIQALVDAAVQELQPEDETKLLYEELFTEEEDGTVGPFISLLRSQEQEEKIQYVDDIRKELEGKEEIPWRELQMAVNVVDAEIDRPHMVQYVCRAFDVPQDQITTAQPTTLDVIVRRLQKSTARRIGKLNSSELT
ncbi:translin-associated factor X-interacting protein 1-like isoform X1 [Lytechinus pictus]|uniref:translin-associated factor X-interacting protein 1-like isoform X1 n=2 Tax=Lytechinus pictus TaxID=7653 RepID=UPI0030B9F834